MSRFVAGLSAVFAVFLIALIFSQNAQAIGSFRLGAMLAVSVTVFGAVKILEKYGIEKGKRGKE
jgi:hypothetical protein